MNDLQRYEQRREAVLGAMHISKHVDIAVEQLAENLGGREMALRWVLELGVALARRP